MSSKLKGCDMIFLDPKSDIAFKKLFGDLAHKNILISFLNSVLERTEGQLITDVTMNNTNNVAETPLSKMSIVDVRCTDQADNQYIIEMQIVTQKNYAARAQYYSSLALSRQLGVGEKYDKLIPVIFVGVLDFALFKNINYLSHHFILDKETLNHELKHLEFHFIELEKFNKTLDQITSILDKWIYFLRHAASMEKAPATFKEPVIKEAFDILSQSNWTRSELEAYDRYLDAFRSASGQFDAAYELGETKGKEEGKLAGKLEVAQQLLDILDIPTIAQMTGLSLEQVKQLKPKK